MEKLQKTLKFTPDDLFYNLQGEISPDQRRRLYREKIRSFIFTLTILVLFAGALRLLNIPLNFYVLLMVLIGGSSLWSSLKLIQDVRNNYVEFVEGMALLQADSTDDSTTHYVTIRDQKFKITRQLYKSFEEGTSYRVYYLPRSRKIIATEKPVMYKQVR